MEELVREHDFVDEVCRWCGGRRSEFLARLTCVPRWVEPPARTAPTSIFNDPAAIGERMRKIQAEEGAAASGEKE